MGKFVPRALGEGREAAAGAGGQAAVPAVGQGRRVSPPDHRIDATACLPCVAPRASRWKYGEEAQAQKRSQPED